MNIFWYSGSGKKSLSPKNPGPRNFPANFLTLKFCAPNHSNQLVNTRVKAQPTKKKKKKTGGLLASRYQEVCWNIGIDRDEDSELVD